MYLNRIHLMNDSWLVLLKGMVCNILVGTCRHLLVLAITCNNIDIASWLVITVTFQAKSNSEHVTTRLQIHPVQDGRWPMQALGHTGDLGQSQPLKVDPKMSDAHDVSKAGQWASHIQSWVTMCARLVSASWVILPAGLHSRMQTRIHEIHTMDFDYSRDLWTDWHKKYYVPWMPANDYI